MKLFSSRLSSVQSVDLVGQLRQSLTLQLVNALEDEEADDAQDDRDNEHQNTDAQDGTSGLMTSQCCVVANQGQTNTGQQAGNSLCSLHQEGLRGAGNCFVTLAKLHFAVVDNVSDAAGGGAQGQAGTEEQECAACDNSSIAGRADVAADCQGNHCDNRQAAGQEVNLFTCQMACNNREQEQADHLEDDGEAEYRVQVSCQAHFLEVVNRECLEQLGSQVEGQQQADEGNQLIVVDDDGEGLLQTGLVCCTGAGGRLFLYVEYGDANAHDEQNNDADSNCGKAGFGNVQEGTVSLLLHNGVVAEHVVEHVDEAQTEGAYDEAAKGSEDTRNNRDAFALMRVRGQVRQPGPVRNVHDGIGHAVQDVHNGNVDVHGGGAFFNAQRGEQKNKEY